MSSLREQILSRVQAALLNATPAAASVLRAREISLTRNIVPAIVLMAGTNDVTRMATQVDKNAFTLKAEIFVRGDVWETLADAIDVPMHQILMTDSQLAALISDIRRTGEEFEGQEADRTAGLLTVSYRVTWLSQAADISKPA